MMIMSFFQAADVLPYVQEYNLLVNGQVVEISAEQQAQLQMKVDELLQNTRTMPAFGVTLPDELDADKLENVYVCLKFDKTLSVNDLPFDELCFRVEKDCHGFNLNRGNNGVFQGRAIYLDILQEGTMNDLYDFVTEISSQLPKTEVTERSEVAEQTKSTEKVQQTNSNEVAEQMKGTKSTEVSEQTKVTEMAEQTKETKETQQTDEIKKNNQTKQTAKLEN